MFKNVATKIALFAFDTATGAAKTGDAANLTAYVSKDFGAVTVLADTSATELSAANAPGWYLFDLTQAETNADNLLFTGKSSTSGVSVVGRAIDTTPNRFSSLVIDAEGLADANAVKVGPTGSGTAQTARDLGANLDTTVSSRASATVAAAIGVVAVKIDSMLDPSEGSPGDYQFSADALSAAIAVVPTATENADTLLNRDMAAVADSNARSPLNALRFLRNKWSLTGSTLTVTKENDTTAAWTAAVSTTPGADPISGSDPS